MPSANRYLADVAGHVKLVAHKIFAREMQVRSLQQNGAAALKLACIIDL
jgi:hypothetical protein